MTKDNEDILTAKENEIAKAALRKSEGLKNSPVLLDEVLSTVEYRLKKFNHLGQHGSTRAYDSIEGLRIELETARELEERPGYKQAAQQIRALLNKEWDFLTLTKGTVTEHLTNVSTLEALEAKTPLKDQFKVGRKISAHGSSMLGE